MIREWKEEDLDAVTAIEADLFPGHPWPREAFLYEIRENPFAMLAIYEKDGETAGYCDLWITYDKAQIANIGVRRDSWGKGIGTKLLEWCLEKARENKCEFLSLEVAVSNTRAIRLYERQGFIAAGRRPHYYDNGEDAVLMVMAAGGEDYDDVAGD